jgi:hypothetical protein
MSGIIYLLHLHYKYEMVKTFCEKEVLESNLRHIIDNLEEAIITKSKNGIGLCNKLGFMILNDIYHDQANEDYLKFRPNIYKSLDDEAGIKM